MQNQGRVAREWEVCQWGPPLHRHACRLATVSIFVHIAPCDLLPNVNVMQFLVSTEILHMRLVLVKSVNSHGSLLKRFDHSMLLQ